MTEDLTEPNEGPSIEEKTANSSNHEEGILKREGKSSLGIIWERLNQIGLGEVSLRIGTGLSMVVLILLVIWVMDKFYLSDGVQFDNENSHVDVVAASVPDTGVNISLPVLAELPIGAYRDGIIRLAQIHTNMPTLPRFDVIQYTVQSGDTLYGISENFNLDAKTILWANYEILLDNPDFITPGMALNILPVDGVYYQWHAGDGLHSVSEYFGVTPEDIVNFQGNHLNPDTLGDYAMPNIEPGTWLVIPGGEREFISWTSLRISRSDPAVAKIYGPGYCGEVMDGPIGNGTFIWPSTETYISGYDFSPGTNHYGIDIGGRIGNPIYGVDSGVVVYAGWNDRGYGNVIVVDHGNGWQSLYAHLDSLGVACGSYVYQGDTIGYMGSTGNSTGPHLHFELRSDELGRVNPMNFLTK